MTNLSCESCQISIDQRSCLTWASWDTRSIDSTELICSKVSIEEVRAWRAVYNRLLELVLHHDEFQAIQEAWLTRSASFRSSANTWVASRVTRKANTYIIHRFLESGRGASLEARPAGKGEGGSASKTRCAIVTREAILRAVDTESSIEELVWLAFLGTCDSGRSLVSIKTIGTS